MDKRWLREAGWLKPDHLIGVSIFGLTLYIFLISPVPQITDSNYTMLVSQSLLEHHTFVLDQYAIPRLEPVYYAGYFKNGDIRELELVNNHIFYVYPPGSSVLSVPYVALMKAFGISPSNPDGTCNGPGETRIQTTLAAILMAALAAIFYYTSRLLLPRSWSVLVALAGALGTQVWSTASRAVWSHTWGIALLGVVVYLLVAEEVGRRKMNPVGLASLLSWAYFVRPTNAVPILAITVYVFIFRRRLFFRYAAVGAAWLALFVAYSEYYFGRMLPSYYRLPLGLNVFWTALVGNLISPSRGLLIYVPVLLFVAYLLARYWKYIALRRLVWLSFVIVLGHLLVISVNVLYWWGGHTYGPRLTTDLAPWFVLLGVLGLQAMLKWRATHRAQLTALNWKVPLTLGAILLTMSLFINARGAASLDTWKWNLWMENTVSHNGLWDWSNPQFLAGLLPPGKPGNFPPVSAEAEIDFTRTEADKYLWYGWSNAESQFRWTDGHEAAVIFALDEINDTLLQMKLGPFLAPGKLHEQRVNINLNGQSLRTLELITEEMAVYEVLLAKGMLREKNILKFELPDAASPKSLKVSDDVRPLGVRMEWIRLRRQGRAEQ